MSRRSQSHPWTEHPELLTGIRTPIEQWHKADWNFSKFEDAVFARPCDPQSVTYSAIDYCVAITSLRDWTARALIKRARTGKSNSVYPINSSRDFRDLVSKKVRWQAAIEAIANTSKHSTYRDNGWPMGIAMPATFYHPQLRQEREACEDGMEVFEFMQRYRSLVWWDLSLHQKDSDKAEPGYVALGDNLDDWRSLLTEFSLAES